MGVIWTPIERKQQAFAETRPNPKYPIRHLWSAAASINTSAISAARSLVDSAGNAFGVFGSGTGSNPSGNKIAFDTGEPALFFDPAGTGQLSSTQLLVGDSSGSGGGSGSSFSLGARVWASSFTTDTVVIYGGGSGSIGLRFNNSGQLELLRTLQALLGTSSGTLTSNAWNSIGVSYNGSSGVFYINGQAAGTFSSSSSFTHTTQHYLGANPSGEWVSNITMRMRYVALLDGVQPASFFHDIHRNPWQLYVPERKPFIFDVASGANTTGTLSSTLDAATLTGVGAVTRSGTLAVTLDAATLAGIGTAAVTNKTGTLAVTLDTATLTSVGAVTRSGTLNSTLDAATLSGAGTVAVGTNRDGTLAVTLDAATLAGIGAVTTSGTLSVTLDAATLAGIGSVGQPRTGTLSVTLDNATLSGVGAIPAAPSTGGGKTTGKNLSRKQKKKLKAVESQEWLKAEETARQLLSDRFTKQTPQEKAQALETHIESLTPVIEALKAITDQIEDVQETVQETKTEELTEHKQILNKFDALITKMTSIEELLIIMLAQ